MTDTKQVIQVLAKSGTSAAVRADKITGAYYFSGDYVETYKKAKGLVESKVQYKLFTNNCVQNTLDAFAASDWRFSLVLYGLGNGTVPNLAEQRVALLPRKQSSFPWLLLIKDLFSSQGRYH